MSAQKDDDCWKQWIGKVIHNTDDEVRMAVCELKKQGKVDTVESLQEMIRKQSAEALNQVLQKAQEQQTYTPY